MDTALKQVATTSTTTAQATQKIDAAAKTAGAALTAESTAAQATATALRQETQATQSASQATSTLTQAARQAAATLAQTGQAAQSTGSQLGGMGDAMRSFASQTGSFALAQVGVQGLQAAFQTAKDALTDLVKTGITMQNLRTSFTAVSGSVQAGAKDFQFVLKTALSLGLGLQSVAEQYRSLSAATRGTSLAGADTRELFTTLSKAAQAYGLSTEQLGRAMTAFQQIISKGKVSMEELRGQLGEAIPGAMQIAARAYGMNTQALEEMISKGLAAEGFTRRFTAQLASEVPAAAERAGKGMTNLGTEITLLKEAIAQSGLLRWLDVATNKTATLLGMMRQAREARQQAAEEESKQSLGPGVTLDKIQADEKRTLVEINKELATTEAQLKQVQGMREASVLARVLRAPEAALLEGRIAALQKARDEAGRGTTERYGREQSIAARQAELAEPGKARKAAQEQEKEYQAFLKEARGREDAAKKAEAAQQAAMKAGLGRDPTLEEKVKLQEKLVKDNQEWLETNQKFAVLGKDDPAVKALRARGQAQEALSKSIVDGKQATQDAASAASKAAQEAEAAEKKKQQALEETARLDKQQADEVGRVHAQSIESLRALNAKYSEAKTETDADRASKLAASLAYSQHTEEANKLAEAIGKATQALEDQRKVEAKLPALREEAQASKSVLDDLTRLQKQLEPSRRGMSTEERLAGTRAEIAAKSQNDPAWLEKADKQIKETLDTELWDKWRNAGLDALDHVGKALEEFVFKGKLNFKDLLGSIAQDIFRTSLSILQQQATKKGGWLEMGLNLGMKVLGIAGGFAGGGGATSGTLPTSWGEYGQMSAAGAFSGKQHGGPVMGGTPYVVGERGPELFVPRTSGTVLPHGQGVASPTVVNVHVSGVQDASSFIQSRGAVSRAMMGALSQARQQM